MILIDIHFYSSVSLTDVIAKLDVPIGIFSQGDIAVIGRRFQAKTLSPGESSLLSPVTLQNKREEPLTSELLLSKILCLTPVQEDFTR